jgi:hypothetical protein
MSTAFARITKVDEAKRLVHGRIAEEVPDLADEIFDYTSSKANFVSWTKTIQSETGGKSLGNVRGMHGNVAAGKLTHIEFNDNQKAIDVSARIVDDNEWAKVLEGVYTGFSMGGSYQRKWSDVVGGKSVTRYTADPNEVSLVDRPCIPTAKFFDIQKADGRLIKREFLAMKFTEAKCSDAETSLFKSARSNPTTPDDLVKSSVPAERGYLCKGEADERALTAFRKALREPKNLTKAFG